MVSLEGYTLLGVGREAEVYALNDRECVKLYYTSMQQSAMEQEMEIMRLLTERYRGAPACLGSMTLAGRFGIRMERLCGLSMLHDAMEHRHPNYDYGFELGREHRRMHEVSGACFRDCREAMRWNIGHASELTAAQRDKLLAGLDAMPAGDRLLHMDYHMDNVVVTPTGLRVIDWTNAACGHPLMDAARTFMTCELHVYPIGMDAATCALLDAAREQIAAGYLRGYGVDRAELAVWMPYLAASRLSSCPPDEYAFDVEIVKRALA